eukprot:scaffold184098_cov38-Tisochrysis_lutea.AAC.3
MGARQRPALLLLGPPVKGAPPANTEQSLAKRPRPPSEADPWPRPHHTQQPRWMLAPPMYGGEQTADPSIPAAGS